MLSPGYSLLASEPPDSPIDNGTHPSAAPPPPDPTSRPPGPASFLIRSTSLDDSTRLSTTPPALLPSPPASAPHALPLPAPYSPPSRADVKTRPTTIPAYPARSRRRQSPASPLPIPTVRSSAASALGLASSAAMPAASPIPPCQPPQSV
ncbi:hypothetical protein C8F04DRAFT_1277738 [Mycena alexandri]|uniref:Uncharacterized protein n=1 Tax=Mycena alexandri TaxID=1745969 RepID=A0AAD6RZH0_9AGAR|nr:hypothetical protein C8F04DRAFT_1277738 [Mycena alexandri]